MQAHIHPGRPAGILNAPPSKSMAHRLLICAALAQGESSISNLGHSGDIDATAAALAALGAAVDWSGQTARVTGTDPTAKRAFDGAVDCGESGSTLRFLIPLFGLGGAAVRFAGAARLFQRPLGPYAELYAARGLRFEVGEAGLFVQGAPRAGRFALRGNVSSQFISGLLFALPLLGGDSTISITPPFESRSYVEMTRAAQGLFGVRSTWKDPHTLLVPGGQAYRPANAAVEGDWSQAAVPAVMAAVCGGLGIAGLREDSTQADKVILDILARAGAGIAWQNGCLYVRPPAGGLRSPGEVDMADCPDLGPVLCALGLFCAGETTLINAGRLRLKESDRIASVEQELRRMGGNVRSGPNWVSITGGAALCGGNGFCAHNDHRVVMALCVAAVCGGVDVFINDAQAVQKSWPSFFNDMRKLGLEVDEA